MKVIVLIIELCYLFNLFTILAGTPAITMFSSKKSLFTTAPAPIITLLAIWISPIIFAPTPISTLSPILGDLLPKPSLPMQLSPCNVQFRPTLAYALTTILP